MLFVISYLLLNVYVKCNNDTEFKIEFSNVNDIANKLVNILNVDNKRITELKQKIKEIDKFVIKRDTFTEFLTNQTSISNLNETNFFNSLNESDTFQFLLKNDTKSLFLKMKERMNRDDIIKILSETNENNKFIKSARKMLLSQNSQKRYSNDIIDNTIDKFIAQKPTDNHKYDFNENNSEWDPQGELEDLKDYHRHDGRRIFKGERTSIKYYPFMASIHVMGRFWCGGTIYWSDIIITSAACLQLLYNNRFYRENPDVLKIRIGSNHSRIGGEMMEALEVYFHPGYNSRTLRHNIALIRLRRHIRFTYHRTTKRLEISRNHLGISPTSEVLILGWGVSKISQKMPYEPIFLNRKILPIYPNVFCKEAYGDKFITTTMFCAGTFTTGEGACDHDAGGPAVVAGKLVGIISFGSEICGYPNTPTVFTLVGAYADWIEGIRDNMPSYYRGKQRTTTLSPFTYYKNALFFKEAVTTVDIFPTFDYTTTMRSLPVLREQKTDKSRTSESDYGWSLELKS